MVSKKAKFPKEIAKETIFGGLSITSVCAILTLSLTILWVSLTTGEYLHQIKENDVNITNVQIDIKEINSHVARIQTDVKWIKKKLNGISREGRIARK